MTVYSVACRGSMNEKSAKCFAGGGWMSETRDMKCPHCGRVMFVTAMMDVHSIGRILPVRDAVPTDRVYWVTLSGRVEECEVPQGGVEPPIR